jgi:hypothetical protein
VSKGHDRTIVLRKANLGYHGEAAIVGQFPIRALIRTRPHQIAAIASGTHPFAANGEYYVGAQLLGTGETMRLLLTVLMCVLAATAFAQNGQNEWIEIAAHDL